MNRPDFLRALLAPLLALFAPLRSESRNPGAEPPRLEIWDDIVVTHKPASVVCPTVTLVNGDMTTSAYQVTTTNESTMWYTPDPDGQWSYTGPLDT